MLESIVVAGISLQFGSGLRSACLNHRLSASCTLMNSAAAEIVSDVGLSCVVEAFVLLADTAAKPPHPFPTFAYVGSSLTGQTEHDARSSGKTRPQRE